MNNPDAPEPIHISDEALLHEAVLEYLATQPASKPFGRQRVPVCGVCDQLLEVRPIQRERGGPIRIVDNYCPDCHATRVPNL